MIQLFLCFDPSCNCPAYKPARALYNAGIGVNAEYECWELGLNYNAKISNKHLGHQGNFKLRLNF